MAALEIELVVRPEHVGVPDYRVLGHAESGEELAHLFDVELGPADAEVVDVHLLRHVPLLLAPRHLARLVHYRAAKEDEVPDLVVETSAQQQRVHDGVVRHVDIGRRHDVARSGGRGRGLDHDVDVLQQRIDLPCLTQIRLVPGHAMGGVSGPSEAHRMDLQVVAAAQRLDEVSPDEAGSPAHQDARALHPWPLPFWSVGS